MSADEMAGIYKSIGGEKGGGKKQRRLACTGDAQFNLCRKKRNPLGMVFFASMELFCSTVKILGMGKCADCG